MAYEHKEGKATLFKNDKGDNPNRPDFSGDGMVNGKIVKISCWVNKNDQGETRLGLNIEEKQQRQESSQSEFTGQGNAELTDEIPW